MCLPGKSISLAAEFAAPGGTFIGRIDRTVFELAQSYRALVGAFVIRRPLRQTSGQAPHRAALGAAVAIECHESPWYFRACLSWLGCA